MTEPHKESHEESPKESPGTNPNSHDDSDVETPAVGDLRGEDVDALRAVVRDILQAVEESEGSDEDNGDENDAAASFTGSMALHSTSPKVKSPGTGAESSAYGPLPSDPARLSTQHPQVPPAFPSSSSGPISSPSTGPHLTTPPFPNPSAATMPRQNQSQGAGSKAGAAKAKADGSDLLERHNKIIAQILTRFRNMVMAATEPIPGGATIEHAALNRMTMETETAALITEIENLLALNREIKALWIRGPLRKPGDDDDRVADIDRKAAVVSDLYDRALAMREQQVRAAAAARANDPAPPPDREGEGRGG